MTEEDIKRICEIYKSGAGIEPIAKEFHIGKLKVKKILSDNGIALKGRGGVSQNTTNVVDDWRIEKYINTDTHHYIYVDKNTGFSSPDINNLSGALTTYIKKQYSVDVPTLFFRRKYYMETGNYWWEQWLDAELVENVPVRKCPYCDWSTVDIENKSGSFVVHLKEAHGKTIEDYLTDYPFDKEYFSAELRKIKRSKLLKEPGNYVECPICDKRMFRMTISHILSHGLTLQSFRMKYPEFIMESDLMLELDRISQKESNKAERKKSNRSKAEREISCFLNDNGIKHTCNNRSVLGGMEIDILIQDKKLGIEYDGLRYHSDDSDRHIKKTRLANKNGYQLIHIFEDEYLNTRELVYDKLKNILNLNTSNKKIPARKCVIMEITTRDAKNFLNAFHMQGFANSTVYLGGFYNEELVGVMTFKRGYLDIESEWELNRFATDVRLRCQGLASKMLSFFIREYDPKSIVSFADRRWTIEPMNTMYTKIGFDFAGTTRPSYSYFKRNNATGEDRRKRYHKLDFRKRILMEKDSSLTSDMTEEEMANKLGFYRIWDCGLFKYVWTKNGTSD